MPYHKRLTLLSPFDSGEVARKLTEVSRGLRLHPFSNVEFSGPVTERGFKLMPRTHAPLMPAYEGTVTDSTNGTVIRIERRLFGARFIAILLPTALAVLAWIYSEIALLVIAFGVVTFAGLHLGFVFWARRSERRLRDLLEATQVEE